ncbi:MAG TPA: helix-turn-helix domain-containing protein [Candidatus Dormibacteraeota bacterium]|nr:helix-turn-helix domain-containing protein [Candidatus Dormibacteraeota bacterium]
MATGRPTTRGYSSPARQANRNRTQLAILQAAEAVFRARGYGAATMQAVADSAGVSLPTVYLHFRSKPDLLRSLADLVTSSVVLSVEHVLAETDPKRQLEIGAGILRTLHERSEVVADVLRSASAADRKVSREWGRWQERHLAAVGAVARSLAARRALRRDVDVAGATDILYAIGGPDTFRQLVRERGWTPERYERWLGDAGQRLLLS